MLRELCNVLRSFSFWTLELFLCFHYYVHYIIGKSKVSLSESCCDYTINLHIKKKLIMSPQLNDLNYVLLFCSHTAAEAERHGMSHAIRVMSATATRCSRTAPRSRRRPMGLQQGWHGGHTVQCLHNHISFLTKQLSPFTTHRHRQPRGASHKRAALAPPLSCPSCG